MPTVPRYGIAQVSPSPIPNFRQSDNGANAADFGGNVAAGIANIGREVADYAKGEQQKADAAKLMEADNAAWQVERDLFYDPKNGVFAKHGQDTFGVQDTVFPEWDKRVSAVEAGLGNDRQRLQFREMSQRRRQSLEQATLRHVSTETDNFYQQQLKATVLSSQDEATANYTDPTRIQQVIDNVTGAIMAANPGEPGQLHHAQVKEATSNIHASVINRMLLDSPFKAQEYYTQHADELTLPDRVRVDGQLKVYTEDAASFETSSDILRRGWAAISKPGETGPAAAPEKPLPSDGLLVKGNIENLYDRKVLNNPDGSYSTTSSMSIGTDAGEVLIPTVIDGVRLSNPDAIAHYRKTGEHLGIFDTPEHADAYASALHESQAARPSRGGFAPTSPAVVQSDYRTLASAYGATITSMTRTPAQNAAVGGAANSQHLAGTDTACDFVVPPDKADAFMADAKARGYQVIDERKKGGTGPHIHLQLPPNVGAAPLPPATRAEAIAIADHITDPIRRRGVMQEIDKHFQIAESQRQESERSLSEAVYTAVYNAKDSGKPLASVLAGIPGALAWAKAKGHASGLENMLTPGATSNTTSLDQAGRIERAFFQAAAGTPDEQKSAQAFLSGFNPYDVGKWQLTQAQRQEYSNKLVAIGKHAPDTIADLTFTKKVIDNAMFNAFGYVSHPQGGKEDRKFDKFTGQLTEAMALWTKRNGKQPGEADVQRMADVLVLDTASGKRYFEIGEAMRGNVPTAERDKIVASLRANNIPVSEDEIARAYINAR